MPNESAAFAASWLWVIGASCLAAELLSRLPFERTVSSMAQCAHLAGHVISSRRISDHWKERVLPAYAGRMAGHTLMLTLYFAGLAGLVALVLLAADTITPGAAGFVTSGKGLLASFAAATAYYLLRRRFARA
jgi:hypothetical protein